MKHRFSLILVGLIILQFLAGLWYISYPMIDGRIHYNWGPSFWLLQAEKINEVGLSNTYWGTRDYPAHPQLIGPAVSLWTKFFGYSEFSIRSLPLLLTLISTIFLALAIRKFLGERRALAYSVIFASLPLIYIYGRKLDQEALVLMFLSIYLYGISKINNNEKGGIILSTVGSFGMALSDWSGMVFAGFISIASIFAWNWKINKERITKFIICSLGASFIGLAIFVIQSYLQAKSPGIEKFLQNYYDLWKFRAGISQNLSWFGWFTKQIQFLSSNYSIPLVILGLMGLFRSIKKGVDGSKVLPIFVLSILLGQLFYMVFLSQASWVHIYYQYFLSVPIAFGLIMMLELFNNPSDLNKKSWNVALAVLFIFTAAYSIYQYRTLLFSDQGGDKSDIELISTIKNIPLDKSVVAAEINNVGIFWYENPNITFYAGRPIKGYLFDDGIPLSDYQLTPKSQTEEYGKAINNGGYGSLIKATLVKCSTNLCLLEISRK